MTTSENQIEVTNKNVVQTVQALDEYFRRKFDVPNKANIRYNSTYGYIYYLKFEYYDVPVPGETDIYEVKSCSECKLIEKPTADQIALVKLINSHLSLVTNALLKDDENGTA